MSKIQTLGRGLAMIWRKHMNAVQKIAIISIISIIFSACSTYNGSSERSVAPHSTSPDKESVERQGCRSKPNFEGMMRTLCY
jgi:hypothetical protein